ncbi:MAG: FtsX-like permease family protein [Gammaproteobacteria bacterium]|nr:FtsX-like permease family protein [Gammaproteobacteria bacterium]
MRIFRRQLVLIAWRHMLRYRLRSGLIIGCAALGVAGAITVVNYASGGREEILGQIKRLGTNIIVVSARQSRAVADRERTGAVVTTLVPGDYRAIRDEILGPVPASASVSSALRLKAGFLSTVAPVMGVEPEYFKMKAWELSNGRWFGPEELRRSTRVALLGHKAAKELYSERNPVGERLFINRVPFEIIGILAERGPGLDASDEDGQVYVPLTAAMRRLLNVEYYNSILFEIPELAAMQQAEKAISQLLRRRHRSSAANPDDFLVQSQRELIDTQIAAADRLQFLVSWIGLSAIIVSGLGILAIAWIGVRDRTREIGTRRALGATAYDVFFQFSLEACVLAITGIAVGIAAGWFATLTIAARAELKFVFDTDNAILAVMVAFVLNLLFACWPAIRAAKLDPINALRHE